MRPDHSAKKKAASSAITDLIIDYEQEISRIRDLIEQHRVAINELTVEMNRIIDVHTNLTASREGLTDAEVV